MYAQLGAGLSSAMVTIAGAMCGGVVFGLVHRVFSKNPKFMQVTRAPSVDSLLGYSSVLTAAVFASVLALIVAGVEYLFPWNTELGALGLTPEDSFSFGITSKAWPPMLSGLVIGLLQIPSYILSDSALGSVFPSFRVDCAD